MAGFFSLGGRGGGPQNKEDEQKRQVNNNTQFLFRNEEIYNRGFQIWPQYNSSSSNSNNNNNYYSFGVGPSRRNSSSSNNVVDNVVSVSDESTRFGFSVMRASGSSGFGGEMNCQDCGNQAKKDCPHLRCRTCCKSRGFQCQTHVKSTWIPAAKRRERHQQHQNEPQQHPQFWGEDHSSRRNRENQGVADPLASAASLPLTATGLELGQYPPELNSSAVFRCVKVSPIDAPDERYAYQTAVNIGGHVFKGILYDQGPDCPYTNATTGAGEGSSLGGGGGDAQQLTLTTATTTGNPFYQPPFSAFMAGTQFFPPRS
ncbi:putative transcription factor STY-LRP1 family [Lupinus albus]|uniref:Putative transcription factor STY-LRP1 family n=1 Tax=Lupinus albus TaxID=3870 RepID=A0A6A4PET1_LUPAL|nr:putative transcription factor STY-LRP1 family [Lupinus albus]